MPIINERWPRDIIPESCAFGRTRNDVLQMSPRSRQTTVIRQGRPLWSADVSWTLPNSDKLAKLRYWLEALDGFTGSTQIWNFASPYPFGLDLAIDTLGNTKIFWSYLSNRSPWTYAGFPSHWALDTVVPLAINLSEDDTEIHLAGLDPNKLVCVQGQYVQVGRRLYLAQDLVQSDGSGNASIELMSPLLAAADAGDEVRLVEAACEMRLADQNWDERARASEGLIVVSAKFIETAQDFV